MSDKGCKTTIEAGTNSFVREFPWINKRGIVYRATIEREFPGENLGTGKMPVTQKNAAGQTHPPFFFGHLYSVAIILCLTRARALSRREKTINFRMRMDRGEGGGSGPNLR